MARVKRGTIKNKRRKNVLKHTKGYVYGRSTKERQGREAIMHAGAHQFNHRRQKKQNFRRYFNIRLNAALHEQNLTFSRFMGMLRKQNVGLNRKMLAEIAHEHPESFKRIIDKVSS
jgi:large subunit ribosomal protein L20